MAVKDTKIIDLNLFSGSSELFRQAVGGYYYVSDSQRLEFLDPRTSNILGVEKIERDGVTTKDESRLQDTRKYANRIYVDKAFDFKSDEHWKKFLVGGVFQEVQYPGIYNTNVYGDHYNISQMPELARENINTSVEPSLLLTTEYYNYYSRYQTTVSNLDSELQIPNFYLLDSSSYLIPSENTGSTQSKYHYSQLSNFLSNEYVNSEKITDTSLENIFVINDKYEENNGSRLDTADLLHNGGFDNDLSFLYSLMPFGNKLEIKEDLLTTLSDVTYRPIDTHTFRDIIENNNYKTKFLKLLKEVFQGESRLQTSDVDFAINTVSVESTGIMTGSIEKTTTNSVKIVDLPTMLLYAYKNPISETNNITIINSSSYPEASELNYVFDTDGIHRFENTEKSLRVFSEFVDEINAIFSYDFIGRSYTEWLLESSKFTKHYETVAFRIQKIGGPPTGDYRTENTLQNIWFYNRGDAIKYIDTQVKYDTEYTYKIYKYVIVQGYKHQIDDFRITNQSALTSSGDADVYCLQFRDAQTDTPVSGLMDLQIEIDSLEHRLTALNMEMDSLLAQEAIAMSVTGSYLDLRQFLFSRGGARYESYKNAFEISVNGWSSFPYALEENIISYSSVSEAEVSDTDGISVRTPEVVLQKILIGAPAPVSGTPASFLPSHRPEDYPGVAFQYIYDFDYDSSEPTNSTISIGPPGLSGPSMADLRTKIKLVDFIRPFVRSFETAIQSIKEARTELEEIILPLQTKLDLHISARDGLTTSANGTTIISSYPYLADFNISVTPSVKIVEIPIEEKRMRIVDHPPNDFVVTPHHLLDQSNRLAFYCKYDTFSRYATTYPPTLTPQDEQNKSAYLTGHDFIELSEQTQESVSRPSFIEVYRTTTKPTSYGSFAGALRKTINLRRENGDIPTDHLFVERVRENVKYYYAFRALNENGIAGQMSPVFEAELINDGGYVYGAFEQFSEDDLAVMPPKEPLLGFKKLLNIVPNIQHLQLDTSDAIFASSSISQLSNISLGTAAEDTLWDAQKYYKIRLTSKKTGKKIDLNISFEQKERK